MLDGLRYVIAQIALIVAVTALLASVLGWLLGHASGTRRAEKAAAASRASRLMPAPVQTSPSFSPRHAMEAAGDVPVLAEEVLAPVVPTSIVNASEPAEAPVLSEAPAPGDLEPSPPIVEPVTADTLDGSADAGADEDADPDRTVLRPAPGMTSTSGTPGMTSIPGTPLYTPPRLTVATPTPSESEPTAERPASMQEVQELRRELRAKELELGKLEAGVFSAWDRTVPHLETQISDLLDENVSLRRQIRDAQEHSDADAKTVERLRTLVAERDSRLAEIRAQN